MTITATHENSPAVKKARRIHARALIMSVVPFLLFQLRLGASKYKL
jgi:hypothetical protein